MKTTEEMIQVLQQQGLLRNIVRTGKKYEVELLQNLTYDSREVTKGTLFICKGQAFRKAYLEEAIEKGCTAYLIAEEVQKQLEFLGKTCVCCESDLESGMKKIKGTADVQRNVTGLIVTDIRKAMAAVSAAFYDYCPGSPKVTGITGTKGKTTTAWYLKAMLDLWQREQEGRETGLISTVENFDGCRHQESEMTTPEAPVIHRILANAREMGLSHVTMEVSSQALKYKRVRGMTFQVGVFLNISEDHISPQEHTDFEDYFSAKLSMLRQTEVTCVNLDCDYTEQILKAARKAGQVLTFGKHKEADIRYSDVRMEQVGVAERRLFFNVTCDRFTERFSLAMHGRFNIENAVAAIAAAYVYGVPVQCMKQALAETTVPGRMESFTSRDGKICALVDFAHNRLSFEKLFDAAFSEYSEYGNIVTVFGCPGGKALNRRRELGIIAGLFSDYVCITSDSPGMECQEKIEEEIKSYVELTGCPCCCVSEREEAVRQAVRIGVESGEPTLILVVGRGSERFQKFGRQSYAYPMDASLVERAIRELE